MHFVPDPRSHVYVLKLVPAEAGSGALRGRVEHIHSGRRHDFDSSQALLDCLRHEEQQVAREQSEGSVGSGRER